MWGLSRDSEELAETMPIPVVCQCGAKFQAKDALAGKRVKCPKCGNPLAIPRPQVAAAAPLEDLLDEVGVEESVVPRCPECKAELKPGVVLCVECGFDLKTGKKLKTFRQGGDDEPEFDNLRKHGNAMLDQAERDILRNKLQEKRMERGAPWWVFLIGVILCAGFIYYAVRYKPHPGLMAGATFGGLAGFVVAALLLTVACNVFSSLEKKFSKKLKAKDELVAPAVGYSMAMLIAYIGVEALIAAAVTPAFGLRWWQGIKSSADIPTAWGFHFTLAVTTYLTLVFVVGKMIPIKYRRAALIVIVYLIFLGVVGGGGYLVYWLMFGES